MTKATARKRPRGTKKPKISPIEAALEVQRLHSRTSDLLNLLRNVVGGDEDFMTDSYEPVASGVEKGFEQAFRMVGSVATKNERAVKLAQATFRSVYGLADSVGFRPSGFGFERRNEF